jgi:hypothetical protein
VSDILRNVVRFGTARQAERAIRLAADQHDYSEIERLRSLLARPFTPQPGADDYAAPPPDDGGALVLSCSS